MKPTDLDEVLDRARQGDDRAIARVYRHLQPQLLRYLRHEVQEHAEDLASETWLAAARGLATFEGDLQAFRAWLFTVARRRVIDHYRTNARRPRLVALDGSGAETYGHDAMRVPDTGDVVTARLTGDEAVSALTSGLAHDQAEVVLLRVVGGLTVEQVATIVDRTPGAVRMLQHRALRKMQKVWPDRDARATVDD